MMIVVIAFIIVVVVVVVVLLLLLLLPAIRGHTCLGPAKTSVSPRSSSSPAAKSEEKRMFPQATSRLLSVVC